MEKKTIGKLIAALRKANGMTQKELGEKLCVSDKTISRWECDECTPELSLIPTIAEIFGITTDELLRGERNNPEREEQSSQESKIKQQAKANKQFRLLLDSQNRKYKNQTLISISILLLGFIASMIANLVYTEGMVAFFIVLGCGFIAEVCQIIFANTARILPDEDDDPHTEQISQFNSNVVKSVVRLTFLNIFLFAFCLPLAALLSGRNFGLDFKTWASIGTVFVLVILPVAYIIYVLFVKNTLYHRGLLVLTDAQAAAFQENQKLLKKISAIAMVIALVVWGGFFVCDHFITSTNTIYDEKTFSDWESFKTYVETDCDRWCNGEYISQNGSFFAPISPDANDDKYSDQFKVYKTVYNDQGEVLCEYYYCPDLYMEIRLNETANNRLPVTIVFGVLESQGNVSAYSFIALLVADFTIAAAVYLIKSRKHA